MTRFRSIQRREILRSALHDAGRVARRWIESIPPVVIPPAPAPMQGEQGEPGLSAYEVAITEGFIGTEAEWVASLKGAKGDPGNPGAKGDKGDQGLQGLAGTTDFTQLQNLPSVFPPAAHQHPWTDITNKPTTFAPSAHSHAPSDITGTAVITTDSRLADNRKPGFVAGDGGTITQSGNKSTGVTLSKLTGRITMAASALAANTTVSFTLTNTLIGANDILVLNQVGGTLGSYHLNASCGAGSASIAVRNITAASLSEAVVIAFAVVKAVVA